MVAVPLALMLSARHAWRDHSLIDEGIFLVVTPVQWAVSHGQRAIWRGLQRTVLLGQADARRLRQLVGLRERAGTLPLVAAEIIAVSPTPMFRSVRIDRGRRHGLHQGAAVLTPAGVVGRIAALGEIFADVLLLSDSTCSLDVIVVRTRARARVRGLGDEAGMR